MLSTLDVVACVSVEREWRRPCALAVSTHTGWVPELGCGAVREAARGVGLSLGEAGGWG